MGISAGVGSVRPGICTSSTRPSVPFDGQVIYETDTKRTLVWQGTAWVMLTDADTPPGLELIKVQTIGSGVTSVTVTDAFSSTYDNYVIMMSGGSTSVAGTKVLQFGTTTTGYYSSYIGHLYSNANSISGGSQNGVSTVTGFESSADGHAGIMTVTAPFLARPTQWQGQASIMTTNGYAYIYGGWLNNTNSYTSFTILANNGTLTGGTITVYGYRKA